MSYLLWITVSSFSAWRSSTVCWQETGHSIAVNGTNSNMSLGHQQDHPLKVYMSLYLLATFLKFLALCVSVRLSFPLGSTFHNHKMLVFLCTAKLQYNTATAICAMGCIPWPYYAADQLCRPAELRALLPPASSLTTS